MNILKYEKQLTLYQLDFKMSNKFTRILLALQGTIKSYQNKLLPNFTMPKLELTETDFVKLLLSEDFLDGYTYSEKEEYLDEFAEFLENFRIYIQDKFGVWAMINQPMMDTWVQSLPGKSYLELMAGNGSLSKALEDRHQDVISTDSFAWSNESSTGRELWTKVEKLDALAAIQNYGESVDVILLAWSPDYDRIDVDILNAIRNLKNHPMFLLIGEYKGATNSQLFWHEAKLHYDKRIARINRMYPNFDLVKDHLFSIR